MPVDYPPVTGSPASAPGLPVTAADAVRALGGRAAVGAYWLSPAGLVMLAATGLALAIRLYLLSRLRYLTGITI